MACEARDLLVEGSEDRLRTAYLQYPVHYDDVLNAVHARLLTQRAATKLDLAALITWKHINNAPWMTELLEMPDVRVQEITAAAMVPDLKDDERVAALDGLPGFGAGAAFTSVLLTAWNPSQFGVYDQRVAKERGVIVSPACTCDWSFLPRYWDHLRRIAQQMSVTGEAWTPRMAELAMWNLSAQTRK